QLTNCKAGRLSSLQNFKNSQSLIGVRYSIFLSNRKSTFGVQSFIKRIIASPIGFCHFGTLWLLAIGFWLLAVGFWLACAKINNR
ncbi:MAG: hypothetical protein EA409_01645, partial [Saprospirales bacterium]